jgi:CHAT domain-containing protein/tetratricopeptide (TPR) repeat protein
VSDAAARDGAAHPLLVPVELHVDRERLALALAVKDLGYEALYRQPERVQGALARLASLRDGCEGGPARAQVAALTDWLDGADAALRGRSAEAVAALDRAYDGLRQAGRTRDAAASQVPKLIALAMLGQVDEALLCGERTRQELLAAADEAAAGRVEINLGSMLLRQHRYPEAAALYRCAAARLARRGDRRHSVMADIGLGTALGWTGEHDEAARIFERASARVAAHELGDLQAVIDNSHGQLALRCGRPAEALRRLEAALRSDERSAAPQALAEARRDLADAYLALNLLPEALALYEQAEAEARAADAPIERAWALMQRGRARARQGASDAAMRDLVQARNGFELLGHRVGAARAAAHAAALALAVGLASSALQQAEQAATALQAAGASGWAADATLLAVRALRLLGRHDEAHARLQPLLAAVDTPGADLGADAAAWAESGLLAHARGDTATASERLERAATLIEERRAELPADEFRVAYASDRREVFDALLALALEATPAEVRPATVLEAMERSRAPALRLAAGRGERATAAGGLARGQLDWTRAEWQRALALGQAERAAELDSRRRWLEAELLERRRRARAASGQAVQTAAPMVRAAELQQSLAPGQALVAYGWCGGRLVAVVATPNALHTVELPSDEVPYRAEQLRFQINALRFGAPAGQRHAALLQERAQAHLGALHRLLWAPLARWVADAHEVVVVPSGLLHTVPFAALGADGRALLDRHALVQTPAAALWARGAGLALPAVPQRLLALGLAGDTLPHVNAELDAVAAAFEAPTVLRDAAATRAALERGLPGTDVLHLACHGEFRADSPAFSALMLADGPLALHDVVSLPAPRAAVVLSACETACSRVAPGDEMLGLTRGFLLAGAPRVVATLWPVQDSAMARLMARFYAGWRRGLGPATALCQAQRALREEQPHPYFWAATVLYGRH